MTIKMLARVISRPSLYCTRQGFTINAFRFYAATASRDGSKLEKTNLNVGTIGHVDHGKTTLTAAITKVLSAKGKAKFIRFDEIDKASEEKKRGITINIAHINYQSDKRRYAHTDCPGHSDFIKNMICGTSQLDAVVLVIAATDGVMAQTKEHILLAKQIGVKNVIVFINKADLVEAEDIELVELEARELLAQFGFDGEKATVLKGSALRALEGLENDTVLNLIKALDDVPEPDRLQDAPLIMPITSSVQIPGRGTVIVGTIDQGKLKKGDPVELKGFETEIKSVATDIQVFRKSVKEVSAGEHCGILCRGVKVEQVHRGMWLGAPGAITTSNLVKASVYLLNEQENGRRTAIRTGFTNRVFSSTWDQTGRLEFKSDMLMPGGHTEAHLVFVHDVPIRKNMPFTIRENREKTIARGIITNIYKPIFVDKTFTNFDFNKSMEKAVEVV